MTLLIFTQKVDKDDPALGFFHRWIAELARQFDSLVVVCLYEGYHDLPDNVEVFSLGKERGASRVSYLFNFYRLILGLRNRYDAVLAHQNQEYPILGGLIWKVMGKKVYMWRNHYAGSFLTSLAAFFCDTIFCTSKSSYTARYAKTVFMPVGVDTETFFPDTSISRVAGSILSLGRVSSSKHIDVLIEALGLLKGRDVVFTASVYGDALPKDASYLLGLKNKTHDLGLDDQVSFYTGVPNTQTPAIYSSHDIFVNASPDGMYDKTIFEATACGCLLAASSGDLKGKISDDFIFRYGDATDLAGKLEKLLGYGSGEKLSAQQSLNAFAQSQSLAKLALSLKETIDKKTAIFVFSGDREDLLREVSSNSAPDTRLYGMNHLDEDFVAHSLKTPKSFFGELIGFRVRHMLGYFRVRGADFVIGTPLLYMLPFKRLFGSRGVFILLNTSLNRHLAQAAKKGSRAYRMNLKLITSLGLIISLSTAQMRELRDKHGIDAAKLRYLPLGVDTQFNQPVFSGRMPYILSVGRDNGRDYATVVEAARLMPDRVFHLVLSRRNLSGITDIPPNVNIFFDLSAADLRTKYREASCLLLITHADGYADGSDCSGQTVLLDGFASGIPVIASRKAYLEDYARDGEHLIVVEPYDTASIIEAVKLIPARGESLARNARRHVEEGFSTERMGRGLSEILHSLS